MRDNHSFIASIIIIIFFIISMVLLNLFGINSRFYGNSTYLFKNDGQLKYVKDSSELYSIWKKNKVKGRIILNISNYLHFVPVDTDQILKQDIFAFQSENPIKIYEKQISFNNYLNVAVQANIAREIYNIIPQTSFLERLNESDKDDINKAKNQDKIIFHYLGTKRVITYNLPSLKEPVLINIDASYFKSSSPDSLIQMLTAVDLQYDIITFCFGKDNPEISNNEREKLKTFVKHFTKSME